METYHESAYRCPRTDYTDRAADIGSDRERRTDVPCELVFRIERVLTDGRHCIAPDVASAIRGETAAALR
jgi:hypothetical protein